MDRVQFYFYVYKDKLPEVIKEAEEISASIGESIIGVLEDLNRKLKNPALAQVIRKLKRGYPRSVAYRGIFPKEVLTFLKVAEESNLNVQEVFKEYMRITEKINSAFNKFRITVLKGLATSLLIYGIGLFFFRTMKGIDLPSVKEMMLHYSHNYELMFLLPAGYFLLFGVRKVAEKVNPVLKNIYKYFTLLKLLAIFKVSNKIGLQSKDVLKMYGELYPELKRKIKRLREDEYNIEGLAKILKDYFSPTESILLVKSVQSGRTEQYLEKVASIQLEKVDTRTNLILSVLGQVNVFIQGILLLYVVLAFMAFMTKVSSMSTGPM